MKYIKLCGEGGVLNMFDTYIIKWNTVSDHFLELKKFSFSENENSEIPAVQHFLHYFIQTYWSIKKIVP